MENITTQYKTQISSIYTDRDVKVDTKASSETKQKGIYEKTDVTNRVKEKLSAPLSVKKNNATSQPGSRKTTDSGKSRTGARHKVTERHPQRHGLAQRDDFHPDLASVWWQLAQAARQWFLITQPAV